MRGAGRRGFTVFELTVVIVVFGVLVTALLARLHYYPELAEKAKMESELRTIKTGLQIKLAELIITNRQAEAGRLEIEDPMQWLDARPANFGGAYSDPPARGKWYFDRGARQLVYAVHNGDRLDLDAGAAAKEIRFRARLLKDQLNLGGVVVESVTGVTLLPVRPYHWR